MAVYILSTGDVLIMQSFQSFTYPDGFSVQQVGQSLDFAQIVNVTTTNNSSHQQLMLQQNVAVNRLSQLSATNQLGLVSRGVKTKDFFTGNLLVFSQVGVKVLPQDLSHVFTINQSVDVNRGLNNLLTLIQTVTVNQVKLNSIVHTLTFVQGSFGIIDSNWQFVAVAEPSLITDYDPSTLAIPPIPIAPLPTILVGGNNALSFNIVEYGDSEKLEHTRVSRRTIGEELIIFRDDRWPKTETLKFKLVDISASQGKGLLNFIEENLAQQIKLSDYLGVRWIGVITNPETSLIQSGRDQGCSGRYDIEIEFQGTQVGYTTSQTAFNVMVFNTDVEANDNDPLTRSVFQTFTIEHIATENSIFNRSLNADLTFAEIAVENQVFNRSLSGTLTFIETPSDNQIFNRSTSETLTFSQTSTENQVFNRSANNVLTFIEVVSNNHNSNCSSNNVFVITETPSENQIFNRSTSNTLTFSETATETNVYTLGILLETGDPNFILTEDGNIFQLE